jgi:plastocyanin
VRRRGPLLALLAGAWMLFAGAAAAQAPTVIGATAHDDDDDVVGMTLTLTRTRVHPGPAEVALHNSGEDPHDMVVHRIGAPGDGKAFPELPPGESESLDMKLKASSKYELYCSLPGHRGEGMEATLKVRRH